LEPDIEMRHCEELLRRSNPVLFRRPLDCFAQVKLAKAPTLPELAMTAQQQRIML
jgi:hypothetical protein